VTLQRQRVGGTAPALAALLLAGSARHRPPASPPPELASGPALHLGPERTAISYDEPQAADKRALLERINRDRAAAGAAPVRYEPRAALAGDRFCVDAALAGSWGHWDTQGRPPYLRWGLAGGMDFESENVAAYSVSSGRLDRPLRDLMMEAHETMMAERPPLDGHRRTILDPMFTHVGIGVAAAAGEFRMTEEFTRVVFDWMEVPAGPVPAGQWARFRGETLPEWEVGEVEIRFEPPPRRMSLAELRKAGSYRMPPVVRTLHPREESGLFKPKGSAEFEAKGRRVSLAFPVERRGHYYVVCYVRRRGGGSGPMGPGTAALVTCSGAP